MNRNLFLPATLAILTAAIACGEKSSSADNQDPRSHAGYIVDSVFAMDEEIRRFRIGLDSVAELENGRGTREELVKAFLSAAARGDSAEFQKLHLTRSEFGYLYFPSSKFSRPPYELAPGLVWFQTTSASNTGITKVMQRLTNKKITLDSLVCDPQPHVQEQNKLWINCVTHWTESGPQTRSARLFGEIIERNGVFKFLSFANEL